MNRSYSLVYDPLFYVTIGFFALLTTGLPVAIGQPNFLPIIQTLALFIFMLIPLRKGLVPQTLLVLGIWLVLQFAMVAILTWLLQGRTERAFHDGFQYGMDTIAWFYGVENTVRPDSFAAQPVARTIELLGIVFGSLISAGLIGVWFLVKAANQAAYSMGILLVALGNGLSLIGTVPLWSLCRIAGYAGLVALFSQPAINGTWRPQFYWQPQRRLIVTAFGLVALGLLLELFLPNLWRTLFRPLLP